MTPSALAICVQGLSHTRTLLPVVAALEEGGVAVDVMTRLDLRPEVERTGAGFIDLYDGYPVEAVDDSSHPIPSRYVTFAGAYGERLAADVAKLSPDLIVYETFSVVGMVIARELGIPYVNVVPNHAPVPERSVADVRVDPRVSTSASCLAAVERLRSVHGIADAHPFYYFEALSPYLNLYPEPPQFLSAAERAAFEPIAHFGSLAPALYEGDGWPLSPHIGEKRATEARVFSGDGNRRRVLVSFGTIVWIYYRAEALAALDAISRACAGREDVELAIGLGGHSIDPGVRRSLERENVAVLDYFDQWAALGEADLFVTHHGLNSTHESIYQRTPMISYPFFADQPLLAARCAELGLAVPLVEEARGAVAPEDFTAALARIEADRADFATRVEEARGWELETIEGREEAVGRMLALIEEGG